MAERTKNVERIFVYLKAHPGVSSMDAAEKLGITHELASLAKAVLHRGTPEEMALVLGHTVSITVMGKRVRQRTKSQSVTEIADKKDRTRQKAQVYQQFAQAIQLLSALPRPEDMAKIIKSLTRGNTLDHLPRVVVYLAELRRELSHDQS